MAILHNVDLDGHTKAATVLPVLGSLKEFRDVSVRPEFVALVQYLQPFTAIPQAELVRLANGFRVLLSWRARAATMGPNATIAPSFELAAATRKLPADWTMGDVQAGELDVARHAIELVHAALTDPDAYALIRESLKVKPETLDQAAIHMAVCLDSSDLLPVLPVAPAAEPCPDPSACECAECSATHDHGTPSAAPAMAPSAAPATPSTAPGVPLSTAAAVPSSGAMPANQTPRVPSLISAMAGLAPSVSCPTGTCATRGQ